MSIFTAHRAAFDNAFRQYSKLEQKNFEGIDPPMVPLLKLLNQMPGVVTTDCCSAHPEKQIMKRMYVAVVLIEKGEQLFADWFDRVYDKIMETMDNPVVVRLRCQLMMQIRRRRFQLPDGSGVVGRNVSVHIPIGGVLEQVAFLRLMTEAAEEIIDELKEGE